MSAAIALVAKTLTVELVSLQEAVVYGLSARANAEARVFLNKKGGAACLALILTRGDSPRNQ